MIKSDYPYININFIIYHLKYWFHHFAYILFHSFVRKKIDTCFFYGFSSHISFFEFYFFWKTHKFYIIFGNDNSDLFCFINDLFVFNSRISDSNDGNDELNNGFS